MINFVLIGCGKIGKRHAAFMSTFGKLLAVCDVDKNRADALANQFDVPAFYVIEDLLHNIKNATVAAVCTPNGLHAQHSMQLLNAGLHVKNQRPNWLITGWAYIRRKFSTSSGFSWFTFCERRFSKLTFSAAVYCDAN